MRLSDFDYELPDKLIAQEPPAERDAARMLVVHRSEQRFEDRQFRDLPSFLRKGDCAVFNDSRVLPSRLLGRRPETGGGVELLLLEPVSSDAREWRALARPGRTMSIGRIVRFDDRFHAEIVSRGDRGERVVRFHGEDDVYAAID